MVTRSLRALIELPRRLLTLAREAPPQLEKSMKASRRAAEMAEQAAKSNEALRADVRAVRRELTALRDLMRDRLQQNTWVLTRAARALEAGASAAAADVQLSGRIVPLDAGEPADLEWGRIGGATAPADAHGQGWATLDQCPGCAHEQFTVVNPWNKFILLERAPDDTSARYDYAVCHACGILFASRRPVGQRHRFLLEHFGEVTAKRGEGGTITNDVLNPAPLTDADCERLRRLAARGVFVSDHLRLRADEHLRPLLRDRVDNSMHTDIIGSLLAPRGWRVLEVRSRTGSILDGLRRAWGAEVCAMPIWESQQFLLREVYGIDTSDLIDFDRFSIPFDGLFDLIICNHLLTHVLRPRDFFAELRARLKPGGCVYLHNEPDDAEFLQGRQSMLATLNPLHLQAFDPPSVSRALASNGFATVFQKHQHNGTQLCLARLGGEQAASMTPEDRKTRLEAYQRAFDRAVLVADQRVRGRFAREWPQVVERAVAGGVAEFDEHGHLRVVAR